MTINNIDSAQAKKQQENLDIKLGRKKAPALVIKTGGLVVGSSKKTYKETKPDKAGQFLVGSPDSDIGMKWTDDIMAKQIKITKVGSRKSQRTEFVVWEGYLGGAGTTYINHAVGNMEKYLYQTSLLCQKTGTNEWASRDAWLYIDSDNKRFTITVTSALYNNGKYRLTGLIKKDIINQDTLDELDEQEQWELQPKPAIPKEEEIWGIEYDSRKSGLGYTLHLGPLGKISF